MSAVVKIILDGLIHDNVCGILLEPSVFRKVILKGGFIDAYDKKKGNRSEKTT